MNQDFALLATPAIARRLVAISRACLLDLDARIVARAAEDAVADAAFDPARCMATPLRRAAMQFILDCGLRCAVPALAPGLDRSMMVAAVAASGAAKLTVATGRARAWRSALAGSPLAKSAKLLSVKALFEAEAQQGRRDGVLILDWGMTHFGEVNAPVLAALCREFPRTLIHADPADDAASHHTIDMEQGYPWWQLSAALFPAMPPLFSSTDLMICPSMLLKPPVWKTIRRDCLALFYNTFLPNELHRYGG